MNLKFLPFMIVRNEEEYIEWPIKFLWEKVDRFFVFDTGSTDQTKNFLLKNFGKKIVFKEIAKVKDHFYFDEKDKNHSFDEILIKNKVMEEMEKMDGDYIVQLDGDDIIVPELIDLINSQGPVYDIIMTEAFDIANETLFYHHRDKVYIDNLGECNGMVPRIWKKNRKLRWKRNPWQEERDKKNIQKNPTLHCVLDIPEGLNIFKLKGQFRFHLHYTYGWKRNKDIEYFRKHVWRGDFGVINYQFPVWFTEKLKVLLEKEKDLPWKRE